MITELALLASINLLEPLIESISDIDIYSVLNISANGPWWRLVDDFKYIDASGTPAGNAGVVGVPAARAAARPFREDPLVDR
jgi:hypothetical protein